MFDQARERGDFDLQRRRFSTRDSNGTRTRSSPYNLCIEKKKPHTIVYGLWSGLRVSEIKTTECCFDERCSTKQGIDGAKDLRRRLSMTMRLEWNSNSFEPHDKNKKDTRNECPIRSGLRVSAEKTIEYRFFKRCSTKQGVDGAKDLRRRLSMTMRLEWNSNLFEPQKKTKKDTRKSVLSGADYGARTRHLHLGKVALYQMS